MELSPNAQSRVFGPTEGVFLSKHSQSILHHAIGLLYHTIPLRMISYGQVMLSLQIMTELSEQASREL